MENNITKTALDMLYLCGCALTNEKPRESRLAGVDLKKLYALSKYHSITALVCEGLERAGELPEATGREYMESFHTARNKAVRKNLLLDTERAKICSFLEEKGIWYMPLKGVILKDLYPKIGLRQMADNDILFDEAGREVVRDWFRDQGYDIEAYDIGNHDVYWKAPVYNYEMHVALFSESHNGDLQRYYKHIKARLLKDAGNRYGYHFTDEDFYVYFLAHGLKHFDVSGIGVRFLLDMYVYLEQKQSGWNASYVESQLEVLGLSAFEGNCRNLMAQMFTDVHTFSDRELSPELRELLLYFLTSGAYGTLEQRVQTMVNKRGSLSYLMQRCFPGTEVLRVYHPMFRHKWLMPLGWIYRGVQVLRSHADKVLREIRLILQTKRK